MEILKGNFLINTKEEAVIANEIFRDSDYVGLYFSASWCPPCQTFLPLLKATYEKIRSTKIKLEIIFVSSDLDNQQMTRFFVDNHGDWFALASGPLAVALRKKMQVYSIPQFVILDKKGKVLSKNKLEDLEISEDPLLLWFSELDSDNVDEKSEE